MLLLGSPGCGRLYFEPLGDPFTEPLTDGRATNDSNAMTDASTAVTDTQPGGDGSSMLDAPPVAPSNDTCNTAIDTVLGGVYMGTTCGANDSVDLSCGVTGTPDVFYTFTSPAAGTYQFRVSNGFRLQFGICPTPSGSCSGNLSVMFGGADIKRDLVIEKTDGTCGAFTLEVN